MRSAAESAPHWLTGERLRAYPQILLVVFGIATAGLLLTSTGLEDRLGRPLGTYFSAFRAGARLALGGEPEAVYDTQRLLEAQQRVLPGTTEVYLWPLPPLFLLLILPFGGLPYSVGLLAWVALGYGSYAVALLRSLKDRVGLWAVFAFPGAVFCALNGQTGLLAAALLTAGVRALERRPRLGGALLGAAAFRPELALLVGVALAAGGQRRALAAAVAMPGAGLLLALALFGLEPWRAWLASLPWLAEVLASGRLPWPKLVSTYGASRLLGAGLGVSAALQMLTAAVSIGALVWAWRRNVPVELKGAVLACVALLAAPLTLYYDLVLLAPALLWLAQDGWRRGWRAGEREALAAAWLWPLGATSLAQLSSLQLSPLVLATLLALGVRRVRAAAAAAA